MGYGCQDDTTFCGVCLPLLQRERPLPSSPPAWWQMAAVNGAPASGGHECGADSDQVWRDSRRPPVGGSFTCCRPCHSMTRMCSRKWKQMKLDAHHVFHEEICMSGACLRIKGRSLHNSSFFRLWCPIFFISFCHALDYMVNTVTMQ